MSVRAPGASVEAGAERGRGDPCGDGVRDRSVRGSASDARTDILGVSGRDMLRAMIAGEDDPNVLAEMARGRLRNKLGELRWALEGTMRDHQRFMLSAQLRLIGGVGNGGRAPQ